MAKMLNAADKAAIAKEKLNIRWVTKDGLNFESNQVLEDISFCTLRNKWRVNKDLEFPSLLDAINYVAECHAY